MKDAISRVWDKNKGPIIKSPTTGKPVSNITRKVKNANLNSADLQSIVTFKKSNFVVNPAYLAFIEYKNGKVKSTHVFKEKTWIILGYATAKAMYNDLKPNE